MSIELIDIAELRDAVNTSLSDAALQAIVAREEQTIIDQFGAHYVGTAVTVTETLPGEEGPSLYLRRGITSVTQVREKLLLSDTSWTTLTENTHFYVWTGEGRLERLMGWWGHAVEVTYVPANDNPARKAALIELVRLAVERTAMKSESVAGEYSYSAPDWELERARILRRLGFMEI